MFYTSSPLAENIISKMTYCLSSGTCSMQQGGSCCEHIIFAIFKAYIMCQYICVCVCQVHKYCIQAVVLRKSWPLSQSQWAFVQSPQDTGKNNQSEQNEVKGSCFFFVVHDDLCVSDAC